MTGSNAPAQAADYFHDPKVPETPVRKFNINFGPQHPAAHGVLQLQKKIRRTGTIIR